MLTGQTLVDSIGAVEEAWGGVAKELGQDPDEVIAATHGRRAIDNLRDLKPELRRASDADMGPHVEEFETRILKNADEYQREVRSRRESEASSRRSSRAASRRASQSASRRPSQPGSGIASPAPTGEQGPRRNSFANELTRRMAVLGVRVFAAQTIADNAVLEHSRQGPVARREPAQELGQRQRREWHQR